MDAKMQTSSDYKRISYLWEEKLELYCMEIFNQTTLRISNTGTWVKCPWKKVGSSGIMHSADFQPNVLVDLLVVNYTSK